MPIPKGHLMALSLHMAFARNAAGQVVAASDLPSIGQAGFLCVGCGGELTLYRPNNSQASFKHARPVACELGALRALHAAALQLLVESRFVETPPLTPSGNRDGGRRMIEEWGGEVSVCTRVDGVPVDLYAETLAGPLIIQVAIKPLYDATTRPIVRALGYAALEISIPQPDEVLSVGDLREVVLHGLKNKIWLWHPATGNRLAQPERRPVEVVLLFGEVERPAARLSMPVAVPPWGVQAGSRLMRRTVNCPLPKRSARSSSSLACPVRAGPMPSALMWLARTLLDWVIRASGRRTCLASSCTPMPKPPTAGTSPC
ncbi:hypothetical protein VSR34_33025 [Paraburkholderia sp. JHI2823]|uniref:hypothetical protein n=1 Tax=Paraburkholderia sp. JHI2823 TaxID=3112960 RepID=UPI00318143A2